MAGFAPSLAVVLVVVALCLFVLGVGVLLRRLYTSRKKQKRGVLHVAMWPTFILYLGCGGGSKTITDLQVPANPRPAFGSLNLVVSTPSGLVTRQLLLDQGQGGGFKKSWPQTVSNHQDNQALTLWRYDFI